MQPPPLPPDAPESSWPDVLPPMPETPPPGAYGTALRKRFVFLGGAVYGLLMRLVFGMPFYAGALHTLVNQRSTGVMLWSFVVVVPLVIGALTVFFSGGRKRSLSYSLIAPLLPIIAFVAGTALLLVEGSICIVIALPIFLLLSSFGGLLMHLLLILVPPPSSLQSSALVSSLLLLPLVTGAWERSHPIPNLLRTSDASVVIAAPPEAIWKLINDAHAIQPDEMRDGLAWKIGVPYPQSAFTVATPEGRVRKLRWDKGVHFDEPITDWQENRYIRWRYVFAPDSFPAGALDEHVEIGGRYFDLVDTSYRLTPSGNSTRLDIHVTYRVTTEFNWYAGGVGHVLVDNAARTILDFYKHRTEAQARSRGAVALVGTNP